MFAYFILGMHNNSSGGVPFIQVIALTFQLLLLGLRQQNIYCQELLFMGESPGLVVMGGDSCSKGLGFESQNHILDGRFFTHLFFVKFVMFV